MWNSRNLEFSLHFPRHGHLLSVIAVLSADKKFLLAFNSYSCRGGRTLALYFYIFESCLLSLLHLSVSLLTCLSLFISFCLSVRLFTCFLLALSPSLLCVGNSKRHHRHMHISNHGFQHKHAHTLSPLTYTLIRCL